MQNGVFCVKKGLIHGNTTFPTGQVPWILSSKSIKDHAGNLIQLGFGLAWCRTWKENIVAKSDPEFRGHFHEIRFYFIFYLSRRQNLTELGSQHGPCLAWKVSLMFDKFWQSCVNLNFFLIWRRKGDIDKSIRRWRSWFRQRGYFLV